MHLSWDFMIPRQCNLVSLTCRFYEILNYHTIVNPPSSFLQILCQTISSLRYHFSLHFLSSFLRSLGCIYIYIYFYLSLTPIALYLSPFFFFFFLPGQGNKKRSFEGTKYNENDHSSIKFHSR